MNCRHFVTLALTLMSFSAAAQLNFENIDGWQYKSVRGDELEAVVGADVLIRTAEISKETDKHPVIKIRTLDNKKKLQKNTMDWRAVIFTDKKEKRLITNDHVFVKDKSHRYIAEVLTDTGTPNMLHSIVMATTKKDKIYLFVFEHHRESYFENVKPIRTLFKNLTLKD